MFLIQGGPRHMTITKLEERILYILQMYISEDVPVES